MQESIVFLVRVQCRRKESSRSLSHLLMSFLLLQLKWTKSIKFVAASRLKHPMRKECFRFDSWNISGCRAYTEKCYETRFARVGKKKLLCFVFDDLLPNLASHHYGLSSTSICGQM